MNSKQTTSETDVLIIGGGPVGLSGSILLGNLGIRSLLAERRSTTSHHPRGHIINTRSMEIFRTLGVAEDIRAVALPQARYRGVIFKTRLAGDELGRIDVRGDTDRDLFVDSFSPVVKSSCPQDMLEPVLKRHAEANPACDVRFGVQVNGLRDCNDGVIATLVNLPDGDPYEVKARYVIAADGARSRVRDWLGVSMQGDALMGSQMGIYFKADLWPWVHNLPYLLLWIYNRDTSGVLISLDGRHRWTYNFAYDSQNESPQDFTRDRCVELIRAAVGDKNVPVEVCSVQPWQMQARTAEHMRSGRVFLAGDAAHPLPPTGGQGMNTGIGDVQNLAWKLKLVLDKRAPETLLDSYEIERLPVARFNVEQSARNARKMADSGLSGILRNDPTVGARIEAPDSGPLRTKLRQAIAQQRSHFDYRGQTFGLVYNSPVIIDDGLPRPPFDVCNYVPNACPGARAPHLASTNAEDPRSSILDIFGGAHFVLLTTDATKLYWRNVVRDLATAMPLDLRVVAVGENADFAGACDRFMALYGIGSEGAVLVRPDGHVAWRTQRPVAAGAFETVIETVVGHSQPTLKDSAKGEVNAKTV